eukprot:TRINITY_DN573_c0_g1_i1.p1 TRINITY_DN573_c0_g1~~TRINITY_DN573_c0_g1_i1.p1  ORF type:complete len:188 (-),score=53.58 TRINITY_DN573_c0_g1_i1:76-591(-)
MASLGKCSSCNKTTYPLEGHKVGPPGKETVFHKACFKCQNPGCGWKLTLGSYKYCDGKVWCANHEPMRGFSNAEHQRGTFSETVEIQTATSAPRLGTINEQVRGEAGVRNAQVADMTLQTALNAPKVSLVNEQLRGGEDVSRNAQVADLSLQTALNAPRLDTINEQVRAPK